MYNTTQNQAEAAAPAHGPYLDKFVPEVYKDLVKATADLRKFYAEVDLQPQLTELVMVRASQLNRCGTCLSIHVPQARNYGVSQRKLDLLRAWREAGALFRDHEKAALELCERLTLLPDDGVSNGRAAIKACEVFHEEQVAALEWGIILINAFNRVSIASAHPLRKY